MRKRASFHHPTRWERLVGVCANGSFEREDVSFRQIAAHCNAWFSKRYGFVPDDSPQAVMRREVAAAMHQP